MLVRGSRPDPRVRAEEDIRSRWSAPAEFGPLSEDVARYLAEHGESAEARWFAAEAYVRIGEPARAQATVLDHAATARAADAPRRFSILLLRQLSRSGPLAPRAKMIRAEVDDEGARDELKEIVASMRAEDGQPPPSIVF